MKPFARALAIIAAIGALGVAACEEDTPAIDVDVNDQDFLDEDDALEITTPDGRIEIEEDGGVDIDN